MLILKLCGDKQDDQFTWSIDARDTRGKQLYTDGVSATEKDAKAAMIVALGTLVEALEFSPIDESAGEVALTS